VVACVAALSLGPFGASTDEEDCPFGIQADDGENLDRVAPLLRGAVGKAIHAFKLRPSS
jgi:hypothetical protein